MEFDKNLQIGNVKSVERRLDKIFVRNKVDKTNFLDFLISQRYDWHCGCMSDPFQPAEEKFHKQYNIHILFSTKSSTLYGCEVEPDLHTFQMSVTNVTTTNQ